jgi:prenyltransferase beta subunit
MSRRALPGKLELDGAAVDGRPAAAARGALAALSAMIVALSIYPACPALAAAPDASFQPNLERTVSYLQKVQNEDGGFGGEPGAKSDPDFSAWVALALAATGINPRDQTTARQHHAGGHSVYTYLTEHAGELSLTTDFERELLVVDAAGTSPYEFGGVNLVAKILQRQLPNGSFPHEAGSTDPGMNDTIFAILALSPIEEPVVQHAVQSAAEWVEAERDCDHGWPSTAHRIVAACPAGGSELAGEPESEVDMTGAAIEALNAAGRHQVAQEVEQTAFEYLKEAQDANGGFPEESGDPEPNVASTAWVVQAMWSAGINPETWLTHSGLATEEPLGYMASMQQEDGHIRWETSTEANGVWMTAYVTPAFAGDPLPILAVPYENLPLEPPASVESGNNGESPQPGSGVISGGGGNGAPLFSRPQPQSKGQTPGGVRLLTSEHTKEHKTERRRNPDSVRRSGHRRNPGPVRRTGRRNPGPARRTPAPTTKIVVAQTSRHHHRTGAAHSDDRKGAAHNGKGRGSASAGAGTGGGARSDQISSVGAGAEGGERAGGQVVRGVLIGAPSSVDTRGAPEPGAPGLHGAAAGNNQTSWLAIGIAGALFLSAVIGMQIERRRPEVIL